MSQYQSQLGDRSLAVRLWLEEKVMIQLLTVKQLIDRDFRKELEYVRMIGG